MEDRGTNPTMSTEEVAAALRRMAPAMMAAWDNVASDETLWKLRAEGPIYRQTPILGHFAWYRRFRAWLLRRSLRPRP